MIVWWVVVVVQACRHRLDDVAQLPRRLHHPRNVVVVCVVVHVCHGGCGRSVTAVGGGGRW